MTSKIKVDNINKVSDDSNIIKKCGTTTTIGSGASNPIVVDGSAITLGRCGGTVALASGATQSGFGRTGTVDWQTGSIKTSTFTAANGEGYFCNTGGGAFTMNLPAGSAGAIVSVQDYNNTFDSNNLTITPNGSEKINGGEGDVKLSTEGEGLTLVYVDGTVGWRSIQDSDFSTSGFTAITATGGNAIVTCGNFKTHIFTGPGTFCVSSVPACATNATVDYFVIAGGGGGGGTIAGGGGAGGFRMSNSKSLPAPTTSPLANPAGIQVSAQGYPIVVGAGGSPGTTAGSISSFSNISSAGGGASSGSPDADGSDGASGSGANWRDAPGVGSGGAGNTPPVSPSQGNPGGSNSGNNTSGGGGGAGTPGGNSPGNSTAGNGGCGSYLSDSFVGPTAPSYGTPGPVSSARYFSGGGGGSNRSNSGRGNGGAGGGGQGGWYSPGGAPGTAGTANTGGGSGGNGNPGSAGLGGSGIVMIRYRFQ